MPLDWSSDSMDRVQKDCRRSECALVLVALGGSEAGPYFANSSFSYIDAALSPNRKWAASLLMSRARTGSSCNPFPIRPATNGRFRVPGGTNPHWRGDGRELYYVDLEAKSSRYQSRVISSLASLLNSSRRPSDCRVLTSQPMVNTSSC